MTADWLLIGASAVLGAVLASFSATAAMRAAAGRDWRTGRSACDHCGARLSYLLSLPLISYGWLGGRCAACRERIDLRHPASELAGALAAVAAILLTPWPFWIPALSLAGLLIAIAVYDLATLRIPNALTLFALPVSVAGAVLRGDFVPSTIGAAATTALLWAGAKLYEKRRGRSGLGLGDVKLAGVLCLWSGLQGAALGLALACAMALVSSFLEQRRSNEPAAFGPFLAISFWSVGLWESAQ